MGFGVGNVWAMSLGRLAVQSALGEPLRAEVEIASLAADEVASLKIKVAPVDAFKAAGLEYNAVLASLQIDLQKRADGSSYLKISSDRAITEPFVDLILEASWNAGRITRDYTLLLDPPNLRAPAVVAPVAAAVPAPAPAPAPQVRPETVQVVPSAPPVPAVVAVVRKPLASPDKKTVTPAVPATAAASTAKNPTQVSVKSGDTAGKIVAAVKPANVTLDQMLLALMRTNPDAFIQGNVNRIKAGAVVELPSEEQASATEPKQATEIIQAQSRDFDAYRRKLAANVPSAPAENSARNISGKVQLAVEDKKPAAAATDKLTLSKGSVQGREDELAKARAAQDAASRAAELTKNISELSKLAAASASASATAVVAPKATPASASQAASAAAITLPPALAVSAPAVPVSASAPAQPTVSVPVKPAVPASQVAPVEQPPEPGFIDELIENPLLPAAAAGLIALLAGLAVFKIRQRKKKSEVTDSAFLESRLQPESFFGVSGGQSVDTSENLATGSSMVYSPSQLDAVDDVDPVAEADVYLAYGRDIQAEEILKDALRSQPDRLAIHQKLLEIYAKRGDAKAFESVATLAFNLTNGRGAQWEQICTAGLALDPDNALYLPGGHPTDGDAVQAEALATQADELTSNASKVLAGAAPVIGAELDLDLDLDFSLDDLEPVNPVKSAPTRPLQPFPEVEATVPVLPVEPEQDNQATQAFQVEEEAPIKPDNSLDFSWSEAESAKPEPVAELEPEPEPEPQHSSAGLDMPSLDGLDFDVPAVPAVAPAAQAPAANAFDSSMLEFDLDSLSLDLADENPTESGKLEPDMVNADPLTTKLALAEEFKAIGDDDGARALIEEVIAEATGDMKAKAQRALSNL